MADSPALTQYATPNSLFKKKQVPDADAHWIYMPCPMRLQSKRIAIGFGLAYTIRRPCTPSPELRVLLSLPLHTYDLLLSRPQPPERETRKNSISLFERSPVLARHVATLRDESRPNTPRLSTVPAAILELDPARNRQIYWPRAIIRTRFGDFP